MLWCDGRLVEGGTLPFDMGDRGLLLGDGVFDTALAVQGRIAFETAHIDRLVAAAPRRSAIPPTRNGSARRCVPSPRACRSRRSARR